MTHSRLCRTLAAAAVPGAIVASNSSHAEEVTVGQAFLASGLDPAEGSDGWALVSHDIAEQLFRVSRDAVAAALNRTGEAFHRIMEVPFDPKDVYGDAPNPT